MKMKVSFDVKKSFYDKVEDKTAFKDADNLAQGSMVRIGTHAANDAPVDTGLLRNTLTSYISRDNRTKNYPAWKMTQGTEYTLDQEYTPYPKQMSHETGFIRRAVDVEKRRFIQVLEERFKRTKR